MAKKVPHAPVNEEVNDDAKDPKRQHNHTNTLKLKIDNLKTFEPLTHNQKRFFEAYKNDEPNIVLHGVAGSGKCIGENELVDLFVSDEIYEKLIAMN